MRFDFALFLVFVVFRICLFAGTGKTFGFTQNAVHVIFLSEQRTVVFIKYWFLCKLIMLINEILKRSSVVRIFTRYVFQYCHRMYHFLFGQALRSYHKSVGWLHGFLSQFPVWKNRLD